MGVAGTSCSAWNSQKHTGPGVRAEALTIPELEQSKATVLNTLASVHSRRSYTFASNSFIAWYVFGDSVLYPKNGNGGSRNGASDSASD